MRKSKRLAIWFIFIVGVLLILLSAIFFRRASFQRMVKGFTTDMSGGTERVATVYSNDGKILAVYEGRIDIADDNNYETQLLVDGEVVNIIGGITIIEEK